MGYVGDIAKVISGSAKNIPDAIERTALKSGVKAAVIGETQKLSAESIDKVSEAAYRATKYGIYGAAGLGAAGAIYGMASPEQSVVGGTASGAGLGIIGGASIGAIAAGIAKSTRGQAVIYMNNIAIAGLVGGGIGAVKGIIDQKEAQKYDPQAGTSVGAYISNSLRDGLGFAATAAGGAGIAAAVKNPKDSGEAISGSKIEETK